MFVLGKDNWMRFIPVLASYWVVGSTVYFLSWKQKGMEVFKTDAKEEDGGGSSRRRGYHFTSTPPVDPC